MRDKTEKSGCRFNLYPFFLCLLFSFASNADEQLAEPVEETPVITETKLAIDFSALEFATPELSVRLIEQYQPAREENFPHWLAWEKKRLSLLADLEQWSDIIYRIDQYLSSLPADKMPWFSLLKAASQLKQSSDNHVRDDISQLLWSDNELTTEQIAEARRLIIRSFLAENKFHDAQRAMLRYRQDYGESGLQWKRLQTKVLLATKHYADAESLLANEKHESMLALKQLVRMKAGEISAASVLAKTYKILGNKKTEISDSLKRQYWMLIYLAADKQKKFEEKINALEQVLLAGKANADEDLISVNADLLWQNYLDYAVIIGNKSHLLLGDDTAWFQQASNLIKKQLIKSRALFAYLGIRAAEQSQKNVSLEQFAIVIKNKRPERQKLVEKLFLNNSRFKTVADVPVAIRYELLDYALSRGKINQAAELFSYLPEPPEGQKRLAWSVRRARVLVLGGEYRKGAEVLKNILLNEVPDKEAMNRIIQVVFDYQKVEQHHLALELFDVLLEKNPNPEFHREVQFWIAESFQAMKKYELSAQHFLTSAMLIKEKQGDPWSQTAQYRAAGALMKAGLINDARSIYRLLLRTTKDKNRKAVIRQKLQQLWLLEGKQANGES